MRVLCALIPWILAMPVAWAQQPIPMVGLLELSGPGATSGAHFKAGLELAAKEINAAGGILGRPVALTIRDTQTSPAIAKALAAKAVDDGAYVVFGPIFSGSVLVSMEELRRAEVPNLVGGEATSITQRGNPYVFRTSFSQANAMPKVGRYVAQDLGARSVAVVYVNNDFGKGGRDALVEDLGRRNVRIAADISTDQGQIDFSGPVLRAKQAGADALFVYLNVDESARMLRELRKQGYDKPVVGETTIMQQSVIDLAGEAANGARGHVGLTVDAPNAAILAYAERFEREAKFRSSHDGLKGYIALYTVKAATERAGRVDARALAQAIRGQCFSAGQTPGLLMDLCYDDKGDLDRESFMVEVKAGKQTVVGTLPPLRPR
ncbi:MAG: ABC transporter substrate-binding protein [Burkholderiales bacterium]|nr:ABC transporter substrate-binding protein [Burkholderiales bacterium]